MSSLLSIENLAVTYRSLTGSTTALKGLDFNLEPGEVVGLVGESGSGKSTAGLAMMGLLDPHHTKISGSVSLQGFEENILNRSEKEFCDLRGNSIGMVFQDPMTSLNPYLPVGYQVMEPLLCHGVSKEEAQTSALELLQQVEIPDPEAAMKKYPHHFSGGMRQRVMIAAALAAKPKLLIADEPTTALDVITQKRVLELFSQRIKDREMGVILITHDLGIVAQLCQRVVVLKDGEVVEEGTADDIYNRANQPYTKALLDAVPRLDAQLFERKIPEQIALNLSEVSISYPSTDQSFFSKSKPVEVVHGVNLHINRGEILGLVGQSGSGKSTLLKAVAGLLPITDGVITFEGSQVHNLEGAGLKAYRHKVQMIFQDPRASLNARMIVRDIIAEPLLNFGICSKSEARERAVELMKKVSLDPDTAQRFPHEFSGGQCQRIGIARALILNPTLLLCDEPVSALDVSIQAEALDLLAQLQEELTLSMLFVSHDLAVVRNLADRVAVMHQGSIVETRSAAAIYSDPHHSYTKELLAAIPIPEVVT